MELSPAEGARWIKRLLDSEASGTQHQVVQQLGVLLGSKQKELRTMLYIWLLKMVAVILDA